MNRAALFLLAAFGLAAGVSCGPSFDESRPSITTNSLVISVVRDTTATIAWLTNERANSLVEYGTTTDYGTVEIDNLYVKSHVITIRNLVPQTNYHLRAQSFDVFGNGPATSEDVVITTLPPQAPPDIVVTEVMYAPVSSTTGEFIELFNNGSEEVDLAGFTFTDGDLTTTFDTIKAFTPGGSTKLAAGAYAVILDSDYVTDTYVIPPAAVLLKTNDTTIGNGLSADDPISLFPAGESLPSSTYGTPLDSLDSIPITSAPTGKSIERKDAAAPDAVGNWCISVDPSGSSPGRANSCP